MVVVNDATHLIDQGPVEVVVLSTRPTSQGVMVFAKLGEERARARHQRDRIRVLERVRNAAHLSATK